MFDNMGKRKAELAFSDYVEGYTLREISVKRHIPVGTVYRWMYEYKWKATKDDILCEDKKDIEETIRESVKKRREQEQVTIENTSYISKIVTTLMRHEISQIAAEIKRGMNGINGINIKNYNKDIKAIMQIMKPYFDRNIIQKTENDVKVSSEDVYSVLSKIVEDGNNAF